MKKKLLPVGLLMSFPIFLSPILIVNSCRSNLPENDEMTLENFVANIKPTLKTNKENLKAQTLASSIQTEEDVKNWYDNLPQSQNGINVTFQYASSDDTKGMLTVYYQIQKGSYVTSFYWETSGFQIETPSTSQPSENQDRIDVEDFISKLTNPVIKENKKSELATTPAENIRTKENIEEWFDGLWSSDEEKGIQVSFLRTETNSNNSSIAKGTLRVYYQIQKGSYTIDFYWETPGFQIETPSTSQPSKPQDQIDVENFVANINPTLKTDKENLKSQTLASSIQTEDEVKKWYDNLPQSQNGINVTFQYASSDNTRGVLRVYYQIQKGSYTTDFCWETSGFKIESFSSSQPSIGTTKFKISFKRSNGKLLNNYHPVINFYKINSYKDGNTKPHERKQFTNPVNEFELPTGTYRCVIDSVIPNGMEVNKEFTISEQNPSYDIIFTPKDLQNEPTPEDYNYQYNDVLFQTEYTDVKDNKVKLSDNIKNNKVTIIMFFKIDCSNSQAMFEEIDRWKQEAGIKDRFDAWLFSTSDSKDRLKLWSDTWKNFKVFYDENRMVRKHYFDDTKVPRICFIDQEGVLISKVHGKVNNLKNYLLELLN